MIAFENKKFITSLLLAYDIYVLGLTWTDKPSQKKSINIGINIFFLTLTFPTFETF